MSTEKCCSFHCTEKAGKVGDSSGERINQRHVVVKKRKDSGTQGRRGEGKKEFTFRPVKRSESKFCFRCGSGGEGCAATRGIPPANSLLLVTPAESQKRGAGLLGSRVEGEVWSNRKGVLPPFRIEEGEKGQSILDRRERLNIGGKAKSKGAVTRTHTERS